VEWVLQKDVDDFKNIGPGEPWLRGVVRVPSMDHDMFFRAMRKLFTVDGGAGSDPRERFDFDWDGRRIFDNTTITTRFTLNDLFEVDVTVTDRHAFVRPFKMNKNVIVSGNLGAGLPAVVLKGLPPLLASQQMEVVDHRVQLAAPAP
jgi:hypothetical protein